MDKKITGSSKVSAMHPSGIRGSVIVCSPVILLPSIIQYLKTLILVLIITIAVLVA